jgi:hypothetical protein
MDDSFFVIGGQQKQAFSHKNEEYTRFGTATIAEYTIGGAARLVVSHVTPSEWCAEGGSVVFKSGSLHGGHLYACTQTEVLVYALPDFQLVRTLSLPCFNDVHHVLPSSNGTLLVVSTGLDMILRIDRDDQIVECWDSLGRKPWSKWSQDEDYRRWLTTKPHDSHPNFVFEHGQDVWVSRFEQKDAICLTDPSKRIDIGIERPHDGHVEGDLAYFTTVDGHVVIANLVSCKVERVIDLHACDPDNTHTGWARGLKLLPSGQVLVAFSTLRVTKFRENVRWVKQRVGLLEHASVSPTHVGLYDLNSEKLVSRRTLDDPQIDVVFSVL